MKPKALILIMLFLASAAFMPAGAQIVSDTKEKPITEDSLRRQFDSRPSFGLYKDNYFVFGIPVGHRPTRENSDVKFQISISQRLTKTVLPWGTYLYLFYTQKCFWNVLEKSMPMTDLNFNPGLGLAKPLFMHDRFIGKVMLMVEHESNGRDSIWSRSWNKISLGANIMLNSHLILHGKAWIPIVDGEHNRDILDYCGIFQVGLQIVSHAYKFNGGITFVKRRSWNPFNCNTILEIGYRFSRRSNQYLYLQYYNGYGEGLLDFKKFHSRLRFGIVIKPHLFSDY